MGRDRVEKRGSRIGLSTPELDTLISIPIIIGGILPSVEGIEMSTKSSSNWKL